MSDEERLADLLLAWEERFEQGQDLPAEELCREWAELAEPLAERIADLKRMAWLNRQQEEERKPLIECAIRHDESREERSERQQIQVGPRKYIIRLRGMNADVDGRIVESSSSFRVGRLAKNEVVINDVSVSRRHAEIRLLNGLWTVCDLNSTNGTFVNGLRLATEKLPLHFGDRIRFGNTVWWVVENLNVSDALAIWQTGDRELHRYVVEAVHEGGMSFVYRVRDKGLDYNSFSGSECETPWQSRSFAVKMPKPEYFQTEEDRQTFLQEAETWKSLGHHPNIVSCWFTKTLGGIPRIFSEYVEGGTLADWIRWSLEPVEQADGFRPCRLGNIFLFDDTFPHIISIAKQIANGLHLAHQRGVIHQDIKPSNIMITKGGTAQITDFGLANGKPKTVMRGEGVSNTTLLATGRGMTLAYCSPEQAQIARLAKVGVCKEDWPKLTRRTDIWSWAVVVVEMLCGNRCWEAGPGVSSGLSRLSWNYRCFNDPFGSADQRIDYLLDLLGRCLADDPERRPSSMAEVLDELSNRVLGSLHD